MKKGESGAGWTDERVDALKAMWRDGLSCGQIAKELGVTRNSCIGKVHRLKLDTRANTRKPGSPSRRVTRQQARDARTQLEQLQHRKLLSPPVAPLQPVQEASMDERKSGPSLLELKPGQCRWPYGDPQTPNFFFCGAVALPECPYCREHWIAAHQPAEPRRRKAA